MEKTLEQVQLMARFKLMVRRTLNQQVDLERLRHDPAYASQRLQELEDAALDEELLVMVLLMRDMFVPPLEVANPPPTPSSSGRSYKLGARAW